MTATVAPLNLDWLPLEMRPLVEKLNDAQTVSLILYGEARSEPVQGIVAVGCVIRNRVRKPGWWGNDFRSVCLAKLQFSCLFPNGGAGNYKRVVTFAEKLAGGTQITNERERQCVWIAHGIIGDFVIDNVQGSTHYHTVNLTPRPAWAMGKTPVAQHGGHVFYNTVK